MLAGLALGVLVWTALAAGPAVAQTAGSPLADASKGGQKPGAAPPKAGPPETGPKAKDPALYRFRTPAGDTVVLVRTPGQPLVHWAVWTPAGAAEDPLYWPGLSVAVAKAGLSGTSEIGSLDREREQQALQAIDRWIRNQRSGQQMDPALLQEAFASARAASDWFAWPRVLAGVPTSIPEVHVLPRIAAPGPLGGAATPTGGAPTGTVLSLSLPPDEIQTVAARLEERRRDPALRAVWSLYEAQQSKDRAARLAQPFARLRAEMLHLAFPGQPRSKGFDAIPDRPPLPTRVEAAAVWRATQHPLRTVHVLVGDLDPEEVQRVLTATLAAPSATPVPPPSPSVTGAAERSAKITGSRLPGAAIGFRRTGKENPAWLEVACRWLAEGWEDPIATALAKPGRQLLITQAVWDLGGTAAKPGLFTVEVMALPNKPGAVRGEQLRGELEAVLTRLSQAKTPGDSFQRAVASWRREQAARLASPAGLAEALAAQLARGADPNQVDVRGEEIPFAQVRDMLRRLIDRGGRIVVTAEVGK